MTFAVEVRGEVKSASSIINVFYYGSDSVGASGRRGYSTVTGVAPVIDLGADGWLVAAMSVNVAEWHRRTSERGLTCKQPVGAAQLPAVFGLHARELVKLREGKRDLADNNYPAFISFPKGEPYTMAQQLCPEEFPKVIASDVKFQSISIELAPNAALKSQLDIKAPWLDEMRSDQRARKPRNANKFTPDIFAQIESN